MDSPVLELLYLYLTTIRFIMQDSRADDTKTWAQNSQNKISQQNLS